ncbi:MAG: alpha/beta hydrolase [Actinomycetota bacterium]|nr:alpha/beta hydrolase [Actinomycetota bacterium]
MSRVPVFDGEQARKRAGKCSHGFPAPPARVRARANDGQNRGGQEPQVALVDDVVTSCETTVNGIRLHWVEAGSGPLVVLLHGFPEFWYSWRHQIPALAAAGYRVVAPDLRGYGQSGKPAGYAAYTGPALTGDVAGLVAACGAQRATVVGHDWGGVVAWATALRHPEVLDKLVILNAPHPGAFKRQGLSPAQLLRSSYIFFFQSPIVPEMVLSANNFAALKWALRGGSQRVGAFTDDDLERYAEAYRQPGALTSTLAYYRAFGRRMIKAARQTGAAPGNGQRRTVTAPTLIIWGRNDPALGQSTADPGDRVPNRKLVFIDEAAHFVQADAPERVNELLINFLNTKPV